jgi:hypothetical protein
MESTQMKSYDRTSRIQKETPWRTDHTIQANSVYVSCMNSKSPAWVYHSKHNGLFEVSSFLRSKN